ncbi:MAG: hypothetical protein ACR2OH_01465 [Microthrixaceae bacterium]
MSDNAMAEPDASWWKRMMQKMLVFGVVAATAGFLWAAPVAAAPPGLPDDNPNKNALVITVTCPDYNGGQPFKIWMPNSNGWMTAGAAPVGHPIAVDVPVAVEKREGNGAHDRTVPCLTEFGSVAPVMPTGKPAR